MPLESQLLNLVDYEIKKTSSQPQPLGLTQEPTLSFQEHLLSSLLIIHVFRNAFILISEFYEILCSSPCHVRSHCVNYP